MNGLKNVRNRRDDALTRIDWKQLEKMLADYYRGLGWSVDHVGTGGSHSRFDGGIDLKLRRTGEYILVQCKHWNAKQVPHNAVHELLGLKVNQNATGAIVITSGEFTQAARQAAAREGHVQLIDGDALRAMLGPLPEAVGNPAEGVPSQRPVYPSRDNTSRNSTRNYRNDKPSIEPIVRLVIGIVALLVLVQCLPRYMQKIVSQSVTTSAVTEDLRVTDIPARPAASRPAIRTMQPELARPQPLSARQEEQALREWQRKNAESMRILEENDRRNREQEGSED